MSRRSFQDCTQVSFECPVEATTYGYRPNLAANIIFLTVFSILVLAHFPLAWRYRLWGYSFAVASGSFLELLGFGGRIMMNDNPWSEDGFRLQIVCLVLAPSFIAAGVYLTLKHLVIYFGPEHSRIKPKFYTWIFIGCDAASIIIQAIGGGVAAAADRTNRQLLNTGNGLIIAGIAFQVATMSVCGLLALDFAFRLWKSGNHRSALGRSGDGRSGRIGRPELFCGFVFFAYITILIRCIYRIPEMAGGWGNPLMRHEGEFMILDSLMIALAAITLTFSYPGYMMPGMMKSPKTATPSEEASPTREEK